MAEWIEDLEQALKRCYDSEPESEIDALRMFRDVLQNSPRQVTRHIGRPLDQDRFEKLAALSATETIAREMAQPGLVGFMVSGSPNGRYLATVLTGHSGEEFMGDGPTEPLAFAVALARAVHKIAAKGRGTRLKSVSN